MRSIVIIAIIAVIIMNLKKNPQNERLILALTIFGEARGETIQGKVSIGSVIRNRVKSPTTWWGRDYIGVCLAPYQFSCWNQNDPNRSYLESIQDNEANVRSGEQTAWNDCKTVANGIIDETIADNTGGATHYHTPAVRPKWANELKVVKSDNAHIFYV